MKRILRTRATRRDLVEIWSYIAVDSPDAADRVIAAIDLCVRMISTHPSVGRRRDELSAGLRSFPTGKYVIYYRDLPNAVRIIRVLHGARNLKRIFSPSKRK